MDLPLTCEEEALIPTIPDDPPGPAGSSVRGCIILLRSPTEAWSTERLHEVIASAKDYLAEGAEPDALVHVIGKAQRILQGRGLATETVE